MELELAEYNEDRNQQFSVLLEKQRRELFQTDNEITKLGINVADLADTIQDIHFFAANAATHLIPHDRHILSTSSHNHNNRASIISLQRSYSSNSFASNSTNGSGTTAHK